MSILLNSCQLLLHPDNFKQSSGQPSKYMRLIFGMMLMMISKEKMSGVDWGGVPMFTLCAFELTPTLSWDTPVHIVRNNCPQYDFIIMVLVIVNVCGCFPSPDLVLIPSTHMAMVGWRPKECHEQTLGKRSSIWSGWSPGWAKKEGDDKMTMLSASIYVLVITSRDQVDTSFLTHSYG